MCFLVFCVLVLYEDWMEELRPEKLKITIFPCQKYVLQV